MDAAGRWHEGRESRRPWRGLAWLIILVAAAGCASRQSVGVEYREGVFWPQDQPKIELRTVLDLHRGGSREKSKFLRWIDEDQQGGQRIFRRPYGIDWVEDDLVICDPDGSTVARITPQGKVVQAPHGLFDTPIDVSSCESGILVSDSRAGRIAVLDQELELVRWLADGLSRPTGIACSDGRVFVSETSAHRIRIIERDGTERVVGRRGVELGEFNFPTALEIIGDDLLVIDTLNFRVQRMDMRTESFTASFGSLGDSPGEMPRLKGIAGDSMGRVWVTDGLLDQVAIHNVDGDFLFSIGSAAAAPIEFSFPAGIASHPDGRVAVVDSLNRRLIIFEVLDQRYP